VRRPGLVGGIDVTGGLDTDGDGRPDTAVVADGPDLVLCTDLDGDALADQVLHIGRDGSVWEEIWEEVVLAVDRLLPGDGG
jgi:hypothetical protein